MAGAQMQALTGEDEQGDYDMGLYKPDHDITAGKTQC